MEPVSRCAERAPPDVPADPIHVPTHEQCDVADCDSAEFGCDASEWQSAPPSRNRSYGRPSGRSRRRSLLGGVALIREKRRANLVAGGEIKNAAWRSSAQVSDNLG